MQLPDGLENRRFGEWNCLVRGLMEVWELAKRQGVERQLEEHLIADQSGMLTELLGRLGYVCSSAASLHTHTWSWQETVPIPSWINGHQSARGTRKPPIAGGWHGHQSVQSGTEAERQLAVKIGRILSEIGCEAGPTNEQSEVAHCVPVSAVICD